MTTMRTVTAADGRQLQVTSEGSGTGVVLLHGGGVTSTDYRRLIAGLAERCTVHTYDRRGYDGGPLPAAGTVLATQLSDLRTVLEVTGARRLFGHSGGAFIALQAALQLPLERVAVYDPPLAVDGLMPTAWVEPFGAAIEAGDALTAVLVMGRSMNESRLPPSVERAATGLFLRTSIGRKLAALLPATLAEVREIAAAAGPASAYAGIDARVLLTHGANGPSYYGPICEHLAAAIPGGRSLPIPKASHNSANVAPPALVRALATFLAATD